jgi:hypothetical protein
LVSLKIAVQSPITQGWKNPWDSGDTLKLRYTQMEALGLQERILRLSIVHHI